jgi:hypothetical protein
VHTAVPSFVHRFGGELLVQLLQLAVTFWLGLSLVGALSLGKGALLFVWLSSLGFASRVILCQG